MGEGVNRKMRRYLASRKGQKKMQKKKKAPAKTEGNVQPAKPTQLEQADRAERTQKLVTGRISSDHPVVRYMIGKLRQVVQEQDFVSKQLQQAEAQAAQARNRLLELRGMRTKYIEDIEAFDEETVTSEETEETPVIEEAPPDKDKEVAA